ncbi:MAG TPA: tetratricopeptide repeat protein [Actinomycetales bacterium]|nr:tetratricopeptide repeat protein [Actinomycetales bacterium]
MTTRALTPDELYSEYRRAEDYLASGRPIWAARIVEPVVEADPSNRAALELLARAYFESAQLGRAESVLRKLVDDAPHDGWARHVLARTLERAGRRDEAAEHRRVATALGVRD